jgi:hypothetical protein
VHHQHAAGCQAGRSIAYPAGSGSPDVDWPQVRLPPPVSTFSPTGEDDRHSFGSTRSSFPLGIACGPPWCQRHPDVCNGIGPAVIEPSSPAPHHGNPRAPMTLCRARWPLRAMASWLDQAICCLRNVWVSAKSVQTEKAVAWFVSQASGGDAARRRRSITATPSPPSATPSTTMTSTPSASKFRKLEKRVRA